jgi:hypothetical protein
MNCYNLDTVFSARQVLRLRNDFNIGHNTNRWQQWGRHNLCFAPTINRRPMKGAVDYRVNMMTAHHMTSTWVVNNKTSRCLCVVNFIVITAFWMESFVPRRCSDLTSIVVITGKPQQRNCSATGKAEVKYSNYV